MNALVVIEPDALTPALFRKPDDLEALLSGLEARVRAVPIDISTPKGRKECASLAHQVARSKTAFDSFGKDLVSGLKAQSKVIDVERSKVWDRIEALQAEIRKPLDDYETAEAKRVADHQNAIQAIVDLGTFVAGIPTSADAIVALTALEALPDRDWQEFKVKAAAARSETFAKLQAFKVAALSREAEAAELARLQAEEAARVQQEREARIAAEAAAAATKEAEDRAARNAAAVAEREATERARIDREKAEAVAARVKAEADTKRAAEDSARERQRLEDKAEANRLLAIQQERDRVAGEQAAAIAETERRERDKDHRKRINSEALKALVVAGLTNADGIKAITAIFRGDVPNISISY